MLKFLLNLIQSKERRWNSGTDPRDLRSLLPLSLQTPRKLRLYGIACCDRISHLIVHPDSQASVELGRRLADGLSDPGLQSTVEENAGEALSLMIGVSYLAEGDIELLHEMEIPLQPAQEILDSIEAAGVPIEAVSHAAEAATHPSESDPPFGANADMTAAWAAAEDNTSAEAEMLAQCGLLREIFGNPFDRSPMNLQFSDPKPAAIAKDMYDANDFSAMPELKTALQNAGCEDARVLSHCDQAIHVRGCWLLDQLLKRA